MMIHMLTCQMERRWREKVWTTICSERAERWSKKKSWWRWTGDSFIMHRKSSTSEQEKIINLTLILWQELIYKLARRPRIHRLITRLLLTSSVYLSSLGSKSHDVSLFLDVIVFLIIIFNRMSKLRRQSKKRRRRSPTRTRTDELLLSPVKIKRSSWCFFCSAGAEHESTCVMIIVLPFNMVNCFFAYWSNHLLRKRRQASKVIVKSIWPEMCTFKPIVRDKQSSSRGFSWVIRSCCFTWLSPDPVRRSMRMTTSVNVDPNYRSG